MKRFRKRTYRSPLGLIADVFRVLSQPAGLSSLARGDSVSHAFRERLMLAVTGVNDCRYCSFLHSNLAAMTGLGGVEIKALLDGRIDSAPSHEIPGLTYAIAWAQADGKPEPNLWDKLLSVYGESTAAQIELALRTIRIGNLAGNSWDAVLHAVTGGRAGLPQA